jgi:hypothetical protein
MKKQTHIPFKKPFWKLLGVSVLSFSFLYGGLVWAATYSINGCDLKRGTTPWGEICQILKKSTDPDVAGRTFTFTVPDVSDATGTAKGGVNHLSSKVGKTVKIENKGTANDFFVPVRSGTELNAFLARKPANVTACEPSASYGTSGSFEGIYRCNDFVCPDPTMLENQVTLSNSEFTIEFDDSVYENVNQTISGYYNNDTTLRTDGTSKSNVDVSPSRKHLLWKRNMGCVLHGRM